MAHMTEDEVFDLYSDNITWIMLTFGRLSMCDGYSCTWAPIMSSEIDATHGYLLEHSDGYQESDFLCGHYGESWFEND